MIAIVDYGLGNTGALLNMLKKVGCTNAVVTNKETELKAADKYILPGVGAFDYAVKMMSKHGLPQLLNEEVMSAQKPLLGVCLGMQLLTNGSEEGSLPGLGWIDAHTVRFRFDDESVKVPHMGWNTVASLKPHPLTQGLENDARFYFVHSYHVVCANPEDELLSTVYGIPFVSAIGKGNITGVQFHPEKSHKFGMTMFRNFVAL